MKVEVFLQQIADEDAGTFDRKKAVLDTHYVDSFTDAQDATRFFRKVKASLRAHFAGPGDTRDPDES